MVCSDDINWINGQHIVGKLTGASGWMDDGWPMYKQSSELS